MRAFYANRLQATLDESAAEAARAPTNFGNHP